MSKYLMGLDAGGGGGRCLLVDIDTGVTTCAFYPWTMSPVPEVGGFAYSLDSRMVWHLLGESARDVLKKANVPPQDVIGIAATSMRQGLVVLDKKGEVLLSTPNRDARAVPQGFELALDRGEEIYQITGHYPSPIFMAARLMWLKENHPDKFMSIKAAISFSDWMGYMLSGKLASEPAQAAESLLFDLQSRKWSKQLIRSLGLPKKILPRLKPAGSRLGKLTKDAAANLGLVAGIPVAVGGPDTQCGLLGSGVAAPGTLGVIAGTTTPVQMVLDEPILDEQMRTWTGLHIIPGLYVLESNAGQMGSSLEWIARLMNGSAVNPVAVLSAEAIGSVPGAHGIRSSIGAAVFNAAAMEPPVDNLTFSTVAVRSGEAARADMARAILEGMAYSVRANIEQIQKIYNASTTGLKVGGGITRSALWTEMISNILNCRVQVSASAEVSALGAAICAGVGAGLYPDLLTGVQSLAYTSREHQPGPDMLIYQDLYQEWLSLRQKRQPSDAEVASITSQVMMAGVAPAETSWTGEVSFRPRIYISAEVGEDALRQLAEIAEVTYKPYRTEGILLVGDDLVETLKNYHVFVTEVDILDAEALLHLPDLRMVVVCRGNPVNVDLNACTAAGIPVSNTPGRNAAAVADLAVGFILMLARNLHQASSFLHQPGGEAGDFGRMGQAHEQFLGVELWNKKIGVIGGGKIGKKVIQRLLPFGVHIFLFDPYLTTEQAILIGTEKIPFERLLMESDFITLHTPVTEKTAGMINDAAFNLMKPGAFLINTARAALVDQEALLDALDSGHLGGYATDVFPVEPPASDDPLLAFPNVIATPHIGGNSREVADHQGELVLNELNLLLEGKTPKHILNPIVLDAFSWTGNRKVDKASLKKFTAHPGPGVTDLDLGAQGQTSTKQVVAEISADSSGMPQNEILKTEVKTMQFNAAAEKLIKIIKSFADRIAADEDMIRFAKGKDVTFSFTVKDLDQSFFMSFINGKVGSGLGDPPGEPNVRLKMTADILDGIFTGRVNATKAATSGKLSFSGDTGKAMSFIRIQGKLGNLYTAAREAIGDPGDLTKISSPASTPPIRPSTPPLPQKPTVSAVPTLVKTGDVRDQILMVADELYAKGWITATGGNVSARSHENPDHIWITPNAIFKGALHPEMMVLINLDARVISETDYTASSERRVHCSIYKAMPDVNAVIHSHAPQATLMALTNTNFLPISTDSAFIGDIPVVPFIMPGTDQLGDEVAKAMAVNGIAVLMQNHGLVVAGSSLRRAADMTETIEVTAQKILTCKMLGIEPPLLPDDIVETLKGLGTSLA